jgi:hypothetical protein
MKDVKYEPDPAVATIDGLVATNIRHKTSNPLALPIPWSFHSKKFFIEVLVKFNTSLPPTNPNVSSGGDAYLIVQENWRVSGTCAV